MRTFVHLTPSPGSFRHTLGAGLASLALVTASPALLAQAAAPAKKPAATKPAVSKAAPRAAVAGAAAVGAAGAVAASRALPAASPEQVQAAGYAHVGDYACEFNQSVKVANHSTEGYMNLTYKGQSWVMKPVLSSTGAIRLEDVGGRTLMIQIANKSMLMDQRAGQRLADECVHANHAKLN
jgi:anti-sigma factor RsiW